jgi:hypothetical protein
MIGVRHSFRLVVQFNFISDLNYKLDREISYANILYQNTLLIDDVWRTISNYLDDCNWSNIRKTCKYIYFMEHQCVLDKRYHKYKVDDSNCFKDVSFLVGYTFFDYPYLALMKKESNKSMKLRSICEYGPVDIDNSNVLIEALGNDENLEWIILDFDCEFITDIITQIYIVIKNKTMLVIPPKGTQKTYFQNKMHNPDENRYLLKIPNSLFTNNFQCFDLDIKLKQSIQSRVNIYIAKMFEIKL